MLTDKELAIVNALIEEEIIVSINAKDVSSLDVIEHYLNTLENLHEKLKEIQDCSVVC